MKNELGRKLTSLTLMTIMFAGGMTIAAPSFMPEAAASEKLMYVSAESSLFGNTFAGAMVVEVIVRDPARDETDEKQAEPTVEVNNEILRMVQGEDGYWYAYFASTAAMATATANANIDMGTLESTGTGPDLCATDCATTRQGTMSVSSTAAVYTDDSGTRTENNGRESAPTLSGVDNLGTTTGFVNGTVIAGGQHNVTAEDWPFVQTWEFSDDDVVTVVFEKAGADEVVELYFEAGGDGMEDYAYIELDRNDAPAGAEVFMTIYDAQLNHDPTQEDSVWFLTNGTYGMSYNASAAFAAYTATEFGDNGALKIATNPNSASVVPLISADNADCSVYTAATSEAADATPSGTSGYHCFTETGSNSGIFTNGDDADAATLEIAGTAVRGTTGTIDYNDSAQSIVVSNYGATINMHEEEAGDEWNSGEPITVTLIDGDRNLNTASDEDLTVATTANVPSIIIGTPVGITDGSLGNVTAAVDDVTGAVTFSVTTATAATDRTIGAPWTLDLSGGSAGDTFTTINAKNTTDFVQRYVSYDMTDLCSADTVAIAGKTAQAVKAVVSYGTADLTAGQEDLVCNVLNSNTNADATTDTFTGVLHFLAFGPGDNHGAYFIEVEETDDNTGVFVGDVEFIMINQNTVDSVMYTGDAISDSVTMVMTADYTGTDAPRVKYNDTDADGVYTGVADQVDAPTHSGTVDFDSDSYKNADTVTITVTDQDLNTDSELIDVYLTQDDSRVGDNDTKQKHILDVYFGDYEYDDDCQGTGATQIESTGLETSGFQLTETGVATGVFTGTFQIPSEVCKDTVSQSSTGLDMFVNYWDFRDAGGNTIEVGDASTVTSNTGTVALDRSVYPVPFTWAQFTDHADVAISGNSGNVTITVAVTDPDYDTSPVGEDVIPAGKVTIKAIRGSTTATLAQNFALTETEATSGVFEYEFQINGNTNAALGNTALRQGDVITADYNDPTDASGNAYLNVDSSTLDLRTGSLLSDKSVYVIGSDAIITIVDPDLNLDYDTVESYTLNLVEWDSDAGEVNLGSTNTAFDAEPSAFRETGENTGIFQTVIEIPATVGASATVVDQGEKIDLEYVDYGPSGENYYNDDTEDVELTIYTSNFGATVELDSKVYTWTDRVFVTIVAPDHNTDSALVDEIGGSDKTLTAQTRESKLTAYKLVETGVDTGIFWGEITLAGFQHDADGSGGTAEGPFGGFDATTSPAAAGPTDGLLKSTESDGITVSFEYTEDSTVVSSSLIRWNIGEVSFDEDSFLSSGSAVISVVDPDMNTNPDSTENFKVDVYSDSDSGGIELTVTETNESTGVFEATIYFTTDDASSGHTLRVSEGDSITAEYSDHTLPEPYSTSDDIDVTATAVIGTSTPPLERAPVANARVVDAFGNSLAEVSVDQQVQIEADLVNGAGGDQSFAYLVQVQDSDGVTVSLAWITGQLSAGQSFSPALSWIPSASGSYEATVFVWESVDNPTALSDTASVSITVV